MTEHGETEDYMGAQSFKMADVWFVCFCGTPVARAVRSAPRDGGQGSVSQS